LQGFFQNNKKNKIFSKKVLLFHILYDMITERDLRWRERWLAVTRYKNV